MHSQKSIIWLVPISVLKTHRMGRGTADKQVGLGLSRGLSSNLHAIYIYIVGIPEKTYYQPNLKHRIKDGESRMQQVSPTFLHYHTVTSCTVNTQIG